MIKITDRRKLLLLLLNDLAALVHVPKIRGIGEAEDGEDKAYVALSDLYTLLSTNVDPSNRQSRKMAAQKLLFYAANLDNCDRQGLQRAVAKRERCVEAEDLQTTQLEKDVHDRKNIVAERLQEKDCAAVGRPKIEEIG